VDVSFRLAAAQADRGRLEIELLGEQGTRPVRLVLNDKGQLLTSDGQGSLNAIGTYQPDKWTSITFRVKDNRFTLLRDGKPVLKDAAFAEPSSMVYAVSFRTGEFRPRGWGRAKKDIPNTEEPVPAAVYRIDDVVTNML